MHPLHLLAWVSGGAFLMNAIPHTVSAAMGRRFPSPFANPPGQGMSSPTVNLLWGIANLIAAWLLLCRVGRFDIGDATHAGAAAAGMLLVGLQLARHFGALDDGRGPGTA